MKKILIISSFFAPENRIASLRFTKFSKYLNKSGNYSITVISRELNDICNISKAAEKDLDFVDEHFFVSEKNVVNTVSDKLFSINREKRIAASKSATIDNFSSSQNKISFKAKLKTYIKTSLLIYNEKKYYKNAKRIINKLDLNEYFAVISTYGPFSAHLIGGYVKEKNPKINWIADFRDIPVSLNADKLFNNFAVEILKDVHKNADVITACSEGVLEGVKAADKNNGYVIPNGFDKDDILFNLKSETNNKKLTFSYCGMLYTGMRDLTALFKAFNELISEKKVSSDNIKFIYAGLDDKEFIAQAKSQNLENNIEVLGFVDRSVALDVQYKSDVLLSASWNTKGNTGILTGKVFEQLLLKKRIICTVMGDLPGSAIVDLLEKSGLGICYEASSGEDGFKRFKENIYSIYKEFCETGYVKSNPNEEEINKYDYKNLTLELEKLI